MIETPTLSREMEDESTVRVERNTLYKSLSRFAYIKIASVKAFMER